MPPELDLFGKIVTGKDVRAAVEATMRKWMPTYLEAVSLHHGRETILPNIRSYVSSFDTDRFSEEQVPSCVIVAPGTFDEPTRRADWSYDVTWSVGIGVVVSGQSQDNTFELCEMYAAASRLVMIQQGALGGFGSGTMWISERYDELAFDDVRTIAAGIVQFAVDVQTSFRYEDTPLQPESQRGPSEVPVSPFTSYGRVDRTETQSGGHRSW